LNLFGQGFPGFRIFRIAMTAIVYCLLDAFLRCIAQAISSGMHSPLTKEDILRLIPDLILLDAGQMSWDQVGYLLNEDLQRVRHLHSVEDEGVLIPAIEDPWGAVKGEMFLFAATVDSAYDPLREEVALNRSAGPPYLMALFNAWLSLKTGYPPNLTRIMTGAVLWGLTEPESEAWGEFDCGEKVEVGAGR
jgi:hypothetical protein